MANALAEHSVMRGQSDEVVFGLAQRDVRAVVTENVIDLRELAARELHHGRCHCGLILTTHRRFPRHDPHTVEHIVTALDRLMSSDVELANLEIWLS